MRPTTSPAACSRRSSIGLYISGATLANCAFNFTGGTLQAAPYSGVNGMNLSVPTTVGTAASNIATVDANGQIMNLGSGTLTGPGQLQVIDSAGGGTVVFGGTGNSTTTTTPAARLSGGHAGSGRHAGPAHDRRSHRRRSRVDRVKRPPYRSAASSGATGAAYQVSVVPTAIAMDLAAVPGTDAVVGALTEPVALRRWRAVRRRSPSLRRCSSYARACLACSRVPEEKRKIG